MFVVDTNILVYAADAESEVHERCRSLVLEWREGAAPWYLTWNIVYEFLRVTTHARVFRRPWSASQAWTFIDRLLASPSSNVLSEGERHAEIVAEMIRDVPGLTGNLLHDAHTAALMREHGIRVIFTRDNGFHRFPFLEVRDPLR